MSYFEDLSKEEEREFLPLKKKPQNVFMRRTGSIEEDVCKKEMISFCQFDFFEIFFLAKVFFKFDC